MEAILSTIESYFSVSGWGYDRVNQIDNVEKGHEQSNSARLLLHFLSDKIDFEKEKGKE